MVSEPRQDPDANASSSRAPREGAGAEVCALCGSTRRTYLFVVGRSRMSRCDTCELVSRSDEGRFVVSSESYALDEDSDRTIRTLLSGQGGRRRLLELVDGSNTACRLREDPAFESTLVTSAAALGALPNGAFDVAFVNGAIENGDPLELMRRVRATLRPGGEVVVVVGAMSLREGQLPRYAFSAAPLTRLTLAAGLRPRSCGILSRSMETPLCDDRLAAGADAFTWIASTMETLGRPVELSSGLLAMHARAEQPPSRPKLSIIMPVFNEALTFRDTFDRVYRERVAQTDREIVIVESNSTDGSRRLVREVEHLPEVRVIYEDRPQGKGHAVRAAIEASTGDFVLIQDADSEYDVADYDIVLGPLLNLSATFVLGSRHMGGRTWKIRQFTNQRLLAYVMNLAHESFTALANSLYGSDMRDPTTMYKAFRRDAYEGIRFTRNRFDFDWELVCKLVRRGHIPIEVPVNYKSRSYAEGKKVRFFRDPLTWLETIVTCRFESLRRDDA